MKAEVSSKALNLKNIFFIISSILRTKKYVMETEVCLKKCYDFFVVFYWMGNKVKVLKTMIWMYFLLVGKIHSKKTFLIWDRGFWILKPLKAKLSFLKNYELFS